MNIRKNNFARAICLATLLITFTFMYGCGSKVADVSDETETTEVLSEADSQDEPEVIEEQEEPEQREETEVAEQQEEQADAEATGEEVLFRISVSNAEGAYISDMPSTKEYSEIFQVEYGREFDVYEVFENEGEGATFYRIEMDGREEYININDAQVLE